MAKNIVDILVIMDRSGSMIHGRADHEGGLRSFVADQRNLDGDVRLTLCQFDSHDPCEVVFDRVPLDQIREEQIQLIPRGGTPLFAGVGTALAHLADRQRTEPADQTIVMVITDGEDTGGNGEWTKERVRKRTAELEAAGHGIIYLGANQDAFEEAGTMGVSVANVANYAVTAGTIQRAYSATSANIRGARSMRASGSSLRAASANLNYTATQRAEMVSWDNLPPGAAPTTSVNETDESEKD